MYDYVKRHYAVNPVPGQRVTHQETGKSGVIVHERISAAHYVHVKFDDCKFAVPCHPTTLDYHGRENGKPDRTIK